MLAHLVDRMGKPDAALGRIAELLEAPLAAAARVDLRLYDPQRSGQFLGSLDGLVDSHGCKAGGHRHTVLRKQLFGLIFVDVHGRAP